MFLKFPYVRLEIIEQMTKSYTLTATIFTRSNTLIDIVIQQPGSRVQSLQE